MNINNLMQKAQKMQKEVQSKLDDFYKKEFVYNYQNGAVTIKIGGDLSIKELKITDSLIDPTDKITLEEMVCEAINNAIELVNDQKEEVSPSQGSMF